MSVQRCCKCLFWTECHIKLVVFCQNGVQNVLGTINDKGDYEQPFVAIKGNFSLAPQRGTSKRSPFRRRKAKGARRAGKGLVGK